jgi:hypothetical protein
MKDTKKIRKIFHLRCIANPESIVIQILSLLNPDQMDQTEYSSIVATAQCKKILLQNPNSMTRKQDLKLAKRHSMTWQLQLYKYKQLAFEGGSTNFNF